MKIMVSACLLGENCKYNGGNNRHEGVLHFIAGHQVISVCPELMGGLSVPRAPGEIRDGVVRNADGTSVDKEYRAGALAAYDLAAREHIDLAILQSRSPSCGVRQIYDGSFSGKKIPGSGVFAKMLLDGGFSVRDAEEFSEN